MPRFDRMTLKAQEAVEAAVGIARRERNQEVGVEHLLLALVSIDGSVAATILGRMGVDVPALKKDLEAAIARKPKVDGPSAQEYFSKEARDVFESALK